MKKNPDDCVQKILSDFAAGIMVAAPLNGLSKNRACCYGISFGIVEPLACRKSQMSLTSTLSLYL
ncbi:MAG: hypothetical protein J5930_07340 [Treponema sp.]|nr:hypothetical protein [Treponema sp.]